MLINNAFPMIPPFYYIIYYKTILLYKQPLVNPVAIFLRYQFNRLFFKEKGQSKNLLAPDLNLF